MGSPTFDDQKPFSWSAQNSTVDTCRPNQHHGHPDTFNFSWHTFPASVDGSYAANPLVTELLVDKNTRSHHLRSGSEAVSTSPSAILGLLLGLALVALFAVRRRHARSETTEDYI